MDTIGFFGLGTMGFPMAANLLKKSGRPVLGFDVVKAARDAFAGIGGDVADSAEAIYGRCNIIFLCLPTNDLLRANVESIISGGAKGTVIVDMGSTATGVIREMCLKARENGFELIDSPVSGGQSGAIAGTLAIMCGGSEAAFEKVKPYLFMMGGAVTYVGGSGCGSTAKIANNMMVGIHLAAMTESFAFAKKAGIDPAKLFEAIRSGFAQSAVLDAKAPKMIARDFEASARIEIHMKDIKNAVALAREMDVEIPMTQNVLWQMQYLCDNGMAKEDQCAMVKYYEHAMGVTVK